RPLARRGSPKSPTGSRRWPRRRSRTRAASRGCSTRSADREPAMTDGEAARNVSYQPTPGLSYDPKEEKYWDPDGLAQEVRRVFEVCHGCRMCFKYCDAFPTLFDHIDREHDGDVR